MLNSMPPPSRSALHGLAGERVAVVGALLCLALASTAAAGCASTTRGEFTSAACGNGQDDDDDKLTDCDDPDCWVYCPLRAREPEIGDASSYVGPDGSTDVSEPRGRRDASITTSKPDDDAGSTRRDASEDDAGMDPGTACKCPPGEVCVSGECTPDQITGEYDLSIRSAYVPLGADVDHCYDYTGAACTMRILIFCDCERPDPYVDVVLNGQPILKAMTPEVRDTQSPVWPAAPTVRLMLKPTDTLTFAAFDWDGLGSDEAIFSCSPDLSTLATGSDVLSCAPKPGTTIKPPQGTNYYITAQARKAKDAGVP